MTRRGKRPLQERDDTPEVEKVTRWAEGRTAHDRAHPMTADPIRNDLAWSTPPVERVRALQVVCDRCQNIIGAVWWETYTDGAKGLLAEAAEPVEAGRIRVRRVRLDREDAAEVVTFWCRNLSHGAARPSVGTLRSNALDALARTSTTRRRRDTARSDVLRVTCSPVQ